MSYSSSLFVFPMSFLSPAAITECLEVWTGCKVSRIDYVITDYNSYYFVHFASMLPSNVCETLHGKKEFLRTRDGSIQVGLNTSNGLDPTTPDTIVQFIVNSFGSYHRYFKKPDEVFIWDEEATIWMPSIDNPFEIREVVMEDDFASPVKAAILHAEVPWAPIKKQKKKRYNKTDMEQDLCRTLFV